MVTSSTLVETVSINYEDFTEGFLTCGTCLCTYDAGEHNPKLLPCSHTVCRTCLESIASQPGVRESGNFRCPNCRETIPLPRNGIVSLPPSFLVNQLLDLMQRQRREIVPKCSNHVSQELLFCETCDCVFCNICTGGTHGNSVGGNVSSNGCEHTVVPFSIAIKRMSEILLYKAHQCIGKLDEAHENVLNEMRKLDTNSEHAFEDINRTFQEIINIVDKRRQELLGYAKKMREDKKSVLQDQLTIIEAEKAKVETQCSGLQYQVEVRNISKDINDLNEKIDSISSLLDPRENCFIRYEHLHNSAVEDIKKCVNDFGSIRTSQTFPSLCQASLGKCSAHLRTTALITAFNYNGLKQKFGGDPVSAELKHVDSSLNVAVKIIDNRDGTYEAQFVPPKGGKYQLKIAIFGRPIKNYPLEFEASDHINPLCIYGCRGSDQHQFVQPVGLAINQKNGHVFVLDTGNGRIKILSQNDCNNSPFNFINHIDGHGLENRAGTGIALLPNSNSLLISNWRSKRITEITVDGDFKRHFSHRDFVEPTCLAVNSKGEIIVVDNGCQTVFIFYMSGKLKKKIVGFSSEFGNKQSCGVIGAIGVGKNDEILIADSTIKVFSSDGEYLREINPNGKVRGNYAGIAFDDKEFILATRVERNRSYIQIFDYNTGTSTFTIDSCDAKLRRPCCLATTKDYHVIVVDLGNDCIKKYKYH